MKLNILKEDSKIILYRPPIWKEIWIIPSMILMQMIYWYGKKWKKFYKFIWPSSHELYNEWDSWSEELWISADVFSDNLKKIWFKLWKNKNLINKEDALIIYYTDSNRLTYYELQLKNIEKLLDKCY